MSDTPLINALKNLWGHKYLLLNTPRCGATEAQLQALVAEQVARVMSMSATSDYSVIAKSIADTIALTAKKLSETQFLMMAGAISVWIEKQVAAAVAEHEYKLYAIHHIVTGEASPNWENTPRTGATRAFIAGITQSAYDKYHAQQEQKGRDE